MNLSEDKLPKEVAGKKGQAADYVFPPFLEAMFKAHAEDVRILAWDLCNEPFNNGGEVYLEWLRHTYQTAKEFGATQPIGVSGAASQSPAGEAH